MSEKRCPGCMKLKQSSPICEHCGYDERRPNDPNQLPAGTILQNQYIVGKVLGQGGFGITYMGWDSFLEIPVAIKEYYPVSVVTRNTTVSPGVFLRNENCTDLFVRNRDRFAREARSLAKLGAEGEVPNIVRVHNLIQANSTAYIIMEFVKGTDLRSYIAKRGGRLTMEETLQLLLPVMQSLEKIHASNIIHRDLSPDNIMVLPNGTTKLIDFGAAHEVRQDELGYQQSTTSIVKHGFAPPEQYTRKGNLGPWTDVYAMCATVFYCLTGTVPPSAPDRQFDGEEIPINKIDPQLRDVLWQGMELPIGKRIQSMAQLCQSLCAANFPMKPGYPQSTVPLADDTPATLPIHRKLPVYTAPVQEIQEPLSTSPVKEPKSAAKTQTFGHAKGILPLAVAALALAAGLILLGRPKEPDKPSLILPTTSIQTVPETTTPTLAPETTVPAIDPDPWKNNILMDTYDGVQRLYSSDYVSLSIYRSDIRNYQIRSVTFLDTLAEEPYNSRDVSHEKNGSVKAWVKPNGKLYDLYIAAEGGINGREACEEMFDHFTELQKVDFGEAFHTEEALSMKGMFRNCTSLTSLDLSGFDTSNVRNMSYMFIYCSSLTSLDLTNFDTSNVTGLNGMFIYCSGLRSLDLSSFDTANVTKKGSMFDGCDKLKDVRNPVLNEELPVNQ